MLIVSYAADRMNNYRVSLNQSREEQIEEKREKDIKMKRDRLRALAREFTENTVI